MKKEVIMAVICALGAVSACNTAEQYEVLSVSIEPGSELDWVGQKTQLSEGGELALGKPLPGLELVDTRMQLSPLVPGRVRLISVVPSLDTEVCDRQTHLLNDTKELDSRVERITISRDLPYAQRRFAEESGLKETVFLSDYRSGDVGRKLGLEIARNHLLARALIVTDARGIVRYYQILPKIYALPDLKRAIEAANAAATIVSSS